MWILQKETEEGWITLTGGPFLSTYVAWNHLKDKYRHLWADMVAKKINIRCIKEEK